MTVVVGTAGHIDHGKTTLLRALTGIDADRLPEERRRGMTIDVGYAHLTLADGDELDFVDVPGHDRLVGNMLVGAGEIDAAMLVVAADDGPRAQTFEHVELLDALGIRHGIAVVTKTDVAGPERTAMVVAAVRDLLAPTTLAGAPVVAVSSTTGDGIDDVRAALVDLRERALAGGRRSSTGAADPVRLAVDRVFSIKGRGLVVTGSLRGGRLERGATLGLMPSGTSVRARELQVHNHAVEAVVAGGRVAINLAGGEPGEIERGSIVTTDPAVVVTARLVVVLRPPVRWSDQGAARTIGPARSLAARGTLRLHLGTAAVDATIRRGARLGADLPDGRRVATIDLSQPIGVAVGDPFVLRLPSPVATVAAGVVLDPRPPVGPSLRRVGPEALIALATATDADPAAQLAARVAFHGIVAGRVDRPPTGTRSMGPWLVAGPIVENLETEAVAAVDAHHDREPLSPGLSLAVARRTLARSLRRTATADQPTAEAIAEAVLGGLVAASRLVRAGDVVRDPGRSTGALPPAVTAAMDRLEALLSVSAPPSLREATAQAGCPPDGVRALESSGRIVRVTDELAWAAVTYDGLVQVALRLATPGPMTPAALRDATGTSRKYVMALLEDLVRRGVLARTPAGHVRGHRA